jgi:hypothetical protein
MLCVLVETRNPLHQVQVISLKGIYKVQTHVMRANRKSRGVASFIPNLVSEWKWLTWRSGRFTNRQESRYALRVGFGRPQSFYGRFGRSRKYLGFQFFINPKRTRRVSKSDAPNYVAQPAGEFNCSRKMYGIVLSQFERYNDPSSVKGKTRKAGRRTSRRNRTW